MADGKVYQFQFPYSSPAAAGAANISHQKTRENSNYYSTTTRHHSTVPAVVSNRRQQIEPHQAVNMAARMGWLRHVLTVLSVVIFVSILYLFMHIFAVTHRLIKIIYSFVGRAWRT